MDRRAAYNKRTAFVRKQRKIFSVVFVTVFIISVFCISSKVYANGFSYDTSDSVKLYKSVMICRGDTLETIALKYMTKEYSSKSEYTDEVLFINNLCHSDNLIPGNRIIVPYYAESSSDFKTPIPPIIVTASSGD